MSVAGRKPKPTHLKVLEGNPGRRSLNKDEPKPRPVAPTRPTWLMAEAKREWGRVVPELERLGLLTAVDRAALATYCQAWARYVEAEERLSHYGGILKSKSSDYVQVSPYSTISKQNAHIVRVLCAEFGLTPSSRGRMSVGKLDEGEEPPWLD
jgi:P27 family predicted phage terminase small subunit